MIFCISENPVAIWIAAASLSDPSLLPTNKYVMVSHELNKYCSQHLLVNVLGWNSASAQDPPHNWSPVVISYVEQRLSAWWGFYTMFQFKLSFKFWLSHSTSKCFWVQWESLDAWAMTGVVMNFVINKLIWQRCVEDSSVGTFHVNSSSLSTTALYQLLSNGLCWCATFI